MGDEEKMGNMFMAFRGTYMFDVINNRRNLHTAFSPVALCTDCLAHTGFWGNFKALRFSVQHLVATIGASVSGSSNAHAAVKLVITGHSMGGSLATLASLFLTVRVLAMYAGSDIVSGLYTFGTPVSGTRSCCTTSGEVLWSITRLHSLGTPSLISPHVSLGTALATQFLRSGLTPCTMSDSRRVK